MAAVVRHVAAAFIGAYVAVSTTTTATVPATQKATTMSDLIPQSAIDAALKRAEAETHAPNYSCFMPSEAYAAKLLEAAAPHIAAHALRQAARMIEPGKVRPAAAISSFRYGDLMRLAEQELENIEFLLGEEQPSPPTRPDEPPVGSFFRVDRTGELYLRMHEGNGDYGYVSLLGDREGDLCTWTDITDHGDTITMLELREVGK